MDIFIEYNPDNNNDDDYYEIDCLLDDEDIDYEMKEFGENCDSICDDVTDDDDDDIASGGNEHSKTLSLNSKNIHMVGQKFSKNKNSNDNSKDEVAEVDGEGEKQKTDHDDKDVKRIDATVKTTVKENATSLKTQRLRDRIKGQKDIEVVLNTSRMPNELSDPKYNQLSNTKLATKRTTYGETYKRKNRQPNGYKSDRIHDTEKDIFSQFSRDKYPKGVKTCKRGNWNNGRHFKNSTDIDDYRKSIDKKPPVRRKVRRSSRKNTPLETEPLILFVSALSEEVTTEILYSAFAKRYPITSARVLYHADGRSKTCGFVNFMAEYDLQKALVEMQDMTGIGKRPIHVRLSYKLGPKEYGFSTSSRSSSSNPYYPYQNYEKFWQPAQSTSSLSSFTTTTTQSQSSAFDYEAYYNYMYQYMMAEQMSHAYPAVQDDDTEEPIIEDDIEEVNKHFLENNEEFYIALEESRWQNVDEIMDSVSNTT